MSQKFRPNSCQLAAVPSFSRLRQHQFSLRDSSGSCSRPSPGCMRTRIGVVCEAQKLFNQPLSSVHFAQTKQRKSEEASSGEISTWLITRCGGRRSVRRLTGRQDEILKKCTMPVIIAITSSKRTVKGCSPRVKRHIASTIAPAHQVSSLE